MDPRIKTPLPGFASPGLRLASWRRLRGMNQSFDGLEPGAICTGATERVSFEGEKGSWPIRLRISTSSGAALGRRQPPALFFGHSSPAGKQPEKFSPTLNQHFGPAAGDR